MTKLFCERCGELVFASWSVAPQEVMAVGNVLQAMTPEEAKALQHAWDRHEGERRHTCRLRLKSA